MSSLEKGKPVIKHWETAATLHSGRRQHPVMGTFLWLSPCCQYTISDITFQPFSKILPPFSSALHLILLSALILNERRTKQTTGLSRWFVLKIKQYEK